MFSELAPILNAIFSLEMPDPEFELSLTKFQNLKAAGVLQDF